MRTVVVMAGQTMADIAIQEYGALEAVFDIAVENQLYITSRLQDGSTLRLPDVTYDAKRQNFCALNSIMPATEVQGGDCGVFSAEFTKEFI